MIVLGDCQSVPANWLLSVLDPKMTDTLYVEAPLELAEKMIDEGFEEHTPFRGFASEAATVVTVASAGLSVGANFVTIVVSRGSLAEFLKTIRHWGQRKALLHTDNEIEIDISVRKGTAKSSIHIKSTSNDGVPQIDLNALEILMNSLFSDNH